MMKAKIFLVFILILIPAFAQEFNAKAAEEITLKIIQSGELHITGSIDRANLSLYIPQDGIIGLRVTGADSWEYDYDKFGNKKLLLEWSNPSGVIPYKIEITVKNKAVYFNSLPPIGSDPKYLVETEDILIDEKIKKMAFPYEKSWNRVAELTILVNDYIEYDIGLVGRRYNSTWVFENRKGVCVEHANLLASLLRASGIPTRYIVGYAYSSVDKRLIGHTWVEVLAEDGSWIPFDPTWLQGGYLDATHIKTANLLDDNQLDVLSYTGRGNVIWKRGSSEAATGDLYRDKVDILDFRLRNITTLSASGTESVRKESYGYSRIEINSETCTINEVSLNSCIDENRNKIFEMYENTRKFFSCGAREEYFFFRENSEGSYLCPFIAYDQVGSSAKFDVEVSGNPVTDDLSILGPSTVSVNEKFILKSSTIPREGYIFYSPVLGRKEANEWQLQLKTPGKYTFYLFSGNSLARTEVNVVEKREFELHVSAQNNISTNGTFLVTVDVKNVIGDFRKADLTIEFDGISRRNSSTFGPYEEKRFEFELTAKEIGSRKIITSVISDSIYTNIEYINVYKPEEKKSVADSIIDGLKNFIDAIVNGFRDLIT